MNKKHILIFTIISFNLINIYAQNIPKPALDTIPEKVYEFVEIQPEFPGGTSALLKYLSANITYPMDARTGGIEGKVFVKIIVNHDGNVVNPIIIRGLYPSIDSAVLVTLQNMPKWKPGMQNGKAVDVYYTIPVYFQLSADSEITSDEKIYSFTEQIPEFIGGEKAMKTYFKENMQYPDLAKMEKIHGKVIVKFIVNENGSLTDVHVTRGIGGGCDEEALRLVKAMPLWTPAKQNGKVVKCYFNASVEF